MDFIIGLPKSKGNTAIFVVVDRLTKYAHFGALVTGFTARHVAELLLEMVVKHHGFPKSIVSDRDKIFFSLFWKSLMEMSGTHLHHSTSYHPQTDGQTEVVNRGLEQYLRAMVFDRPQQWYYMLCWAEYYYNTSYNSSIRMTPYQALYGKLPPSILPYVAGSSKNASLDDMLQERGSSTIIEGQLNCC